MPSKKQRRKRDKERRHEYELILVDETGEERPIDPAELRAKRQGKDADRAKTATKSTKGQTGRGNRPIREVKPPTWNRVLKRAAFFGVFMFIVLSVVPSLSDGDKHSISSRLVPTILYTVLFAPLLFLIDRIQYRQYLRRIGQEPPAPSRTPRERPPAEAADGEATGLGASLKRTFRR